ncbi:MAG TPA: hypothetical protein VMV05_02470 [bacterium]|nr:hypothetical protein [bacterium]
MNPKKIFTVTWAFFGAFLLYWIFRFWGHFPAFMDTLEYVFPEKWFNVQSFGNGRIPLWNPWIACGTPHLAAFQPAPFYPPFWLWNLTGLPDWFFVVALAHVAFAAVGFYLWARELKAPPIAASLCAMGFAGSALMTFYWGFPTHLASVAWIPWVFYATTRYLEKPGWVTWGLVGGCWTLHILAGYPIFTFYALLFWAAWVSWKARGKWMLVLGMGSAYAAALAATAGQWLPFMDFLGFLHRDGLGGFVYNLRWTNYLTLFQPQVLGTAGMAGYKGDYPDFIFNNFYLGIVPLGLLVLFFFSKKSGGFFWKAWVLFWFLWPAGEHFFPWRIVPLNLLDRLEPAKSVFLFVFCAFTALALGLGEHFDRSSHKKIFWKGSIALPGSARGWAWALGVLWFLDVLLVPFRVVQTVPDPYRDPKILQTAARAKALVGQGRVLSLKEEGKIYSPNTEGIAGSMAETAAQLTPNTNTVLGLRGARGYLTIYTDGFQNLNRYFQKGYPYDGRLLDAAGVKLILFPEKLPGFKYGVSEKSGDSFLIQNAGAMGQAWQTANVRNFPGRPEVLDALLDPRAFLEDQLFTEDTPQGRAVLLPAVHRALAGYEAPSFWERFAAWGRDLFQDETKIQNRRVSPCEAQFKVESSRNGFLVFDETFSPGWHAWVDGQPKPIFRAYGLWMAVLLPEKGGHEVFFRYEPGSFRLGLFLSLLTLVFMGGGIWLKRHEIHGLLSHFS